MARKRKGRDPIAEVPAEDTVIHGYHPETADFFTMDYDHRDPHLEARPKRQDLNYVGPGERSRRARTHRHYDY